MAKRQEIPPTLPAQAPEEAAAPPVIILAGKDEMNLAEFPIARLGRNDTRLTIEYHGQIIDKTGGVIEQKWIVSGSAQFGLPTEFAERVLVGLMTLTAREQFADRKMPFTIYRVLKLLGLTHNQRNYQAVEKALHQLVGVTIYSEGAFWDKAKQKRVTSKKGFHLVEEFWLKSWEGDESAAVDAGLDAGVTGYIIWGERLWESFKAGYIKHLDANFYYSLDNTIARRLYRFLDKRMHYQDEYQIDIFDLAARLGMKAYRYPSDVARKLRPAFDELQARGYLAGAEVIKVGKFTRIKFMRAGTLRALQGALWDAAADDYATADQTGDQTEAADEPAHLKALYSLYNTSTALKQAWANVLAECTATMPTESQRLIADSVLVDLDGSEAVVAVSAPSRDWVERQMPRRLMNALRSHLGAPVTTITFITLA